MKKNYLIKYSQQLEAKPEQKCLLIELSVSNGPGLFIPRPSPKIDTFLSFLRGLLHVRLCLSVWFGTREKWYFSKLSFALFLARDRAHTYQLLKHTRDIFFCGRCANTWTYGEREKKGESGWVQLVEAQPSILFSRTWLRLCLLRHMWNTIQFWKWKKGKVHSISGRTKSEYINVCWEENTHKMSVIKTDEMVVWMENAFHFPGFWTQLEFSRGGAIMTLYASILSGFLFLWGQWASANLEFRPSCEKVPSYWCLISWTTKVLVVAVVVSGRSCENCEDYHFGEKWAFPEKSPRFCEIWAWAW